MANQEPPDQIKTETAPSATVAVPKTEPVVQPIMQPVIEPIVPSTVQPAVQPLFTVAPSSGREVEALQKALGMYKPFSKPMAKIAKTTQQPAEPAIVAPADVAPVAVAQVEQTKPMSSPLPPMSVEINSIPEETKKEKTEKKVGAGLLIVVAAVLVLAAAGAYLYHSGFFDKKDAIVPEIVPVVVPPPAQVLPSVQILPPITVSPPPIEVKHPEPVSENEKLVRAILADLRKEGDAYVTNAKSYNGFCSAPATFKAKDSLPLENRMTFSCHESPTGYLVHIKTEEDKSSQYCSDSKGFFVTLLGAPSGVVCPKSVTVDNPDIH